MVPGSSPLRVQVPIAAGETKTVPLSVKKAAIRPEPEHVRPPPVPPPAKEGHIRTAGFVVGGVGVAGLVVAVAAGAGALSKLSQLEKECGKSRCTNPEYGGVVDEGRRWQTTANIALTVGAAATVAGGLMIVLGGPAAATGTRPVSQRASVGVAPAPGGAALWIAYPF